MVLSVSFFHSGGGEIESFSAHVCSYVEFICMTGPERQFLTTSLLPKYSLWLGRG